MDCVDVKQRKRMEQFQEITNKRVLVDWVRITGLRNPHKWKYDRLLEHLARVITKYQGDGHPMPFTWPAPAGEHAGIPAYRARVSYPFWRYFVLQADRTPR
ncbi:hypothetical protein Aduo_000606 [Ancylostoma duodenale]